MSEEEGSREDKGGRVRQEGSGGQGKTKEEGGVWWRGGNYLLGGRMRGEIEGREGGRRGGTERKEGE